MIASRFDDTALVALCVDNTAPTSADRLAAARSLTSMVPQLDAILYDHPNASGLYARQQASYSQLRYFMAERGWTCCGSGYFAVVFFKGGLAIKVGLRPRDSGLFYAAWCRANKGRAGVPDIHAIQAGDHSYAVLMDRYEAITCETTQCTYLYDAQIDATVDSIRAVLNQGIDAWTGGVHMDVCHTALDIREFFAGLGVMDVRENNNFMLDREGNVVITDPIADAEYTYSDTPT